MRVTDPTVVAHRLNPQEWRRDLLHVSQVVGSNVATRISGHVRALETQIEALEAAAPMLAGTAGSNTEVARSQQS